MKHSTFRKSSLISSVALLLVAIVALSGATFAWFSTKPDASATGIKATTTQASQLVVSKIATGDWTQNLDLEVEQDVIPVTPLVVDEDGEAVLDAETSKAVKVTDLSTAAWKTASAESFDTQKAYAEEGKELYQDAAATNYIKERIYVKWAASEGTYPLKADLTATAANASSTNFDFYRAAIVPVTPGAQDTEFIALTDGAQYIYSYKGYTPADGAAYGNYDVVTVGTDLALGTISADKVYAFDIYVWFEGEDADCKDTYSTNDISLELSFK